MKNIDIINKINSIIIIVNNQKRSLISLDYNLDFEYSELKVDKEDFIECKFEQQNALEYTNAILRHLKGLQDKLKDN
jgi:Na+-transporting NADH:ubiquinone oxidoreductase subunit NqrA